MVAELVLRRSPGSRSPWGFGRKAELEWVRRCPDPMPGEEATIEIRPVFDASDFGAELAPELRAQEERLAAEIARQKKG